MADETAPSPQTILGQSKIFTPEVINDIHMKAELGRYRMRGFSLFKKMPGWDDLVFLPGTLTRFVIEGYREKCETKTVLGARFAKKPIELDVPVYITGMSFGALSIEAKMALAKGASMAGTATCSVTFWPMRWPPRPTLQPWPMKNSAASASIKWCGLNPYRLWMTW